MKYFFIWFLVFGSFQVHAAQKEEYRFNSGLVRESIDPTIHCGTSAQREYVFIQQPDGGVVLGVGAERTVSLPIIGASLQGRKEPLPSSEELQKDEEGLQVASDVLLDALRAEYNAW